jgi:hypothetical protein
MEDGITIAPVKKENARARKVYLSGKITGTDLAETRAKFAKAKAELMNAGFEVVNPMALPHDHDKSWNSYMRECIKALMDCDALYLIEGVPNSKGLQLELHIAFRLGIRVTDRIGGLSHE